jgi:hypothetical protein
VVVGSSGQMGSSGSPGSSSNKHPVMRVQQWRHGSVIFQVEDSVATGLFVDADGVVQDRFQLIKPLGPAASVRAPGRRGDLPEATAFTQTGRRLWFDPDNAVPFQVYSLDGRLVYRGIPAGSWDADHESLPAGPYHFRHGGRYGRLLLP